MRGDADQLHMAIFCAAFCRRPLGDDSRVLVLYAVTHFPLGQHVEEMVMWRGKAPEVGYLRIGKVLVLLHEPLLIRRGLPVHPNVKGNAI